MGCMGIRRLTQAVVAAVLLAGCAANDAHIPDFARGPFEPFSRQAAVAIAVREWRAFGEAVADETPIDVAEDVYVTEQVAGLWQRIGEYWWLGLDADQRARARTGKHDEYGNPIQPANDAPYAWSAVFVSYVMRMAGATRRFPYSPAHFTYINEARRASLGLAPPRAVWAERIADYAPDLGDLICFGRAANRGLTFDALPARSFASHCDIVVGREPGRLAVIGGNVDDAVAFKYVPVTADGRLADADGPVDRRYPWFVVVRVLYER